jgi:hypothetical protein
VTFADLRTQLAADLAVLGIPVSASWPEVLVPPCAFLVPPRSGTWVEVGPNFAGEFTVHYDLVILVDHDAAGPAVAALEQLVAVALEHTADWSLSGVDAPAPTTVTDNGAEYLAAVMHLRKPARIY